MKVTLYTRPSCVACMATKRWLKKNGVNYATVDVSIDDEARDYVLSLGYTSAPVVSVEIDGEFFEHFSGFREDRLEAAILVRTHT